jgi:DNA-binding transcriptional ArsR family regulator
MHATDTVRALAALAHEHRLGAYRLLVEAGPDGLPAGVIAERLGILPSSLTFHVQQLRNAGLVVSRRASRQILYATDFAAMNALVGYLTRNCCGQDPDRACAAPVCKPAAAARKRVAVAARRKSA